MMTLGKAKPLLTLGQVSQSAVEERKELWWHNSPHRPGAFLAELLWQWEKEKIMERALVLTENDPLTSCALIPGTVHKNLLSGSHPGTLSGTLDLPSHSLQYNLDALEGCLWQPAVVGTANWIREEVKQGGGTRLGIEDQVLETVRQNFQWFHLLTFHLLKSEFPFFENSDSHLKWVYFLALYFEC